MLPCNNGFDSLYVTEVGVGHVVSASQFAVRNFSTGRMVRNPTDIISDFVTHFVSPPLFNQGDFYETPIKPHDVLSKPLLAGAPQKTDPGIVYVVKCNISITSVPQMRMSLSTCQFEANENVLVTLLLTVLMRKAKVLLDHTGNDLLRACGKSWS